jgi:hypothetical protein
MAVLSGSSIIINHEEIRAIGMALAERIGSIATQELDHEEVVRQLAEIDQNVPHESLSEEDLRLSSALSQIESEISTINNALTAEASHFDGLVATFEAKQPKQVPAVKKLVAKKKETAKAEAEQKLLPLKEPHANLLAEYQELSLTIESVSTPWPAPAYEITSEAEYVDDDEDVDYNEQESPQEFREVEVKEIIRGPYAELAASIPDLYERLETHASKHIHIYDGLITAKQTLEAAQAKPEADRTQEENDVMKAVFMLRRRWLMNPDKLKFLKIYDASDIIELATRLNRFRKKDRPNFSDLEGKMLDKASAKMPMRSTKHLSKDLKGVIGRMHEDKKGRTGMTWHSLQVNAERACDLIQTRFIVAGGAKNEYLKEYIIEIADRSGTKPDLSWVYQFIADDFAFDVLAKRIGDSQATAKERFERNCNLINDWFEETKTLVDQLPKEFRLKRLERDGRKKKYFIKERKIVYENVTARTSILGMIEDIRIRLAGTGDGRTLRHKSVDEDPTGALNHQLRLGHTIAALKAQLTEYMIPSEGSIEEITPFDE